MCKLKRIVHSIVLMTIFLSLFSACQDEFAQPQVLKKKALVLGFAQLGDESGWRSGNTISIQKAASDGNIQLMFSNAEQKQENQIKAIRSLIAYRVDVIAFAPIVENGWDNVLTEAKQAGIPVFLTDRYIRTDDAGLYACYIGSNFQEEGKRAARFLKKKFADEDRTINIVELSGTVGASPALGRSEGFYKELSDDSKFKIITSQSGDFMRSKGKEVMNNMLKKYRNIDVLYSHNDAMTLGAIDAIERAGIRPGKDIVIISIDGEQAAIDLLKIGKINCVIECNPMLGPTIVDTAKKLVRGESVPKNIYSEEKVFTEWDDLNDLPPRGY